MLEVSRYEEALGARMAAVPCPVVLPEWLLADFPKRGMAPTEYHEARRYPRYHLRGHNEKALLQCLPTLPTLPALTRPPVVWPVYTLNVSRGGLGFLHFEQLFPGEWTRFMLPGKITRLAEVVWCRRLGSRCYAVGARWLEKLSIQEMRGIVA